MIGLDKDIIVDKKETVTMLFLPHEQIYERLSARKYVHKQRNRDANKEMTVTSLLAACQLSCRSLCDRSRKE